MNTVNAPEPDRDPQSFEELLEWRERIGQMPGRPPYENLSDLKQITLFVGAVTKEFDAHMALADHTETALELARDNFNTANLAHYNATAHRRLFALLSALYSRVEYQRRWVIRVGWAERDPADKSKLIYLSESYRSEIAKIARDGSHDWIMGLRRIVIHRSLPDTGTGMSWSRSAEDGDLDTVDFNSFMVREALLRDHPDEWTKGARDFMERSGSQIFYREVLTTYVDRVFRMDRAIAETYVGEHLDEIEAFRAELHRHDEFITRTRGNWTK